MRLGKSGVFAVLLCACAVSIAALAASTSAANSHPSSARNCGSFNVRGSRVTNVRVRNVSCAQAKRMLVRYHRTGAGLNCVNPLHRPVSDVRCTRRVVARRNGAGSGPRFVTAVITYVLNPCDGCEIGD